MRCPLALVALLSGGVYAGEAFDTSALSRVPDSTQTNIEAMKKEDGSASEGVNPSELKSLGTRIEGFSKVVKTARSPQEKARFLTTLATLLLQKGRALAVDPKSLSYPDERKDTFTRAAKAAEQILAIKQQSRKTVAYAHYLAGLACAGTNDTTNAEAHFVKLLETWPQAPYAATVALHLADLYAEDAHHDKAVALLKKYASYFSPNESALARLKTARSLTAMKQLGAAEELLKTLVRDPKASVVSSEAIKDLAFVSTRLHSDSEVMQMADEIFLGKPDHKAAFLSSAWSNFQKSGMNHQVSRVFAGLMQTASSADKRVRLWIDETRANRQPYASMRHYSGVFSIEQELNGLPSEKSKAVRSELGSQIIAELEMLVRSFADTYMGREKNVEFRLQAGEFKKMLTDIELAERAKSSIGREPATTVSSWPWPDSGLKSKVLAQLSAGQLTAALLILDLDHEKGLLSDNDYYVFRAGCLLAETRNEVLQAFACGELKQAGLSGPKICAN